MSTLTKQEIRKLVREKKQNSTPEQRRIFSDDIFSQVEQLPAFKAANCVMVYWSLPDEVYTHDFVMSWYRKKEILLPVIRGKEILPLVFKGMEELVKGQALNILEPCGEPIPLKSKIDLVLVPGVAFDSKNNRVGRGGGYYDRFLSVTETVKIGICFNFQQFERVPTAAHDVPVDMVISNR